MGAILSPSLLSANFAELGAELAKIEAAGVSWLHLDVMDGRFAPNITFGAPLISSLRKRSRLFFDVHLMVEEPERHIPDFVKAGADLLVPHIEAMRHPQKTLEAIRGLGLKAGAALNPDTDPARLKWLLPYLDMILIMGVNPGFSGQKFIPETLDKLRDCRGFLAGRGFGAMPVQVDGGASLANAAELVDAGATILVSGSAFFGSLDLGKAAAAFKGAGGRQSVEAAAALADAARWAGAAARG